MDKIIQELLSLPKEQRAHLIVVLKNSLSEKGKSIEERFKIMKKAADRIIGEDILSDNRKSIAVYGRRMVAYAMRQEGFSLQAVGNKLKKDHSTICSLAKGMQDILDYPHIFKAEVKMWNAFKESIHYDDSRAS